jgi:hypothetical protein
VAQTVDDGFYNLTITAEPRVVLSKKGATSVILPVSDEEGTPIKIRPLLVDSPGGDSDLVYAGKATLEALLGLGDDDTMDLGDALAKLAGVEFHAELQGTVDHREQLVMDIVDVLEVYGPATAAAVTITPATKSKEG